MVGVIFGYVIVGGGELVGIGRNVDFSVRGFGIV